jgi:hypothetical protein
MADDLERMWIDLRVRLWMAVAPRTGEKCRRTGLGQPGPSFVHYEDFVRDVEADLADGTTHREIQT